MPSASVLKAMLLVAYLNRVSVRSREIRDADRALLGPMIRRSDNDTANRVLGLVGASGVYRVASRARMEHFVLHLPIWGHSEIIARDQARFFRRIDAYVPVRHRGYTRFLLAHVIPSQRWGIPAVVPDGYRIFFKGGWGSGTGRVTHQVALLEQGETRISLAILTEFNPSHRYGTATIRGVAARPPARRQLAEEPRTRGSAAPGAASDPNADLPISCARGMQLSVSSLSQYTSKRT